MSPTTPKVESSGDVRILTFGAGDLRDMAAVIARELDQGVGRAGGHLLLDFTHVTRIGSEELGLLVGIHKRVQLAGGRLTLFNLSPAIYEVFTVTHLDTLLRICRGS